MTGPLGGLASQSVKSLGPSAALVSVLPSAVVVLTAFALNASGLYPGSTQRVVVDGTPVDAGWASIAQKVQTVDLSTGILLGLIVVVLAVMLRPLQIALVQLLEGHWYGAGFVPFEAVLVEYHLRRLSKHRAMSSRPQVWSSGDAGDYSFALVASREAMNRRIGRRSQRGARIVADYPRQSVHVMPTRLGNVLRRAETSAGERYGLDTVLVYRRLYPFLSDRLHAALAVRFDVLDTMATFVIVFAVQAAISLPVAASGTWWWPLPLVFGGLAVIAYSGALATARRHGELLHSAFDLHRFDLYAGLHHELPATPSRERELNQAWSDFLRDRAQSPTPRYHHVDGARGSSRSAEPPVTVAEE